MSRLPNYTTTPRAARRWPTAGKPSVRRAGERENAVTRERGRQQPLPSQVELTTVSNWFNERLDELHGAGLFARLSELARGAPPSASDSNDGEGHA